MFPLNFAHRSARRFDDVHCIFEVDGSNSINEFGSTNEDENEDHFDFNAGPCSVPENPIGELEYSPDRLLLVLVFALLRLLLRLWFLRLQERLL